MKKEEILKILAEFGQRICDEGKIEIADQFIFALITAEIANNIAEKYAKK